MIVLQKCNQWPGEHPISIRHQATIHRVRVHWEGDTSSVIQHNCASNSCEIQAQRWVQYYSCNLINVLLIQGNAWIKKIAAGLTVERAQLIHRLLPCYLRRLAQKSHSVRNQGCK